jgi:hypothetical protein
MLLSYQLLSLLVSLSRCRKDARNTLGVASQDILERHRPISLEPQNPATALEKNLGLMYIFCK